MNRSELTWALCRVLGLMTSPQPGVPVA